MTLKVLGKHKREGISLKEQFRVFPDDESARMD